MLKSRVGDRAEKSPWAKEVFKGAPGSDVYSEALLKTGSWRDEGKLRLAVVETAA
jgi:hypothetical protein